MLGLAFGDLHVSPRAIRVEEHEQIRGAVASVFIVDVRGFAHSQLTSTQ